MEQITYWMAPPVVCEWYCSLARKGGKGRLEGRLQRKIKTINIKMATNSQLSATESKENKLSKQPE